MQDVLEAPALEEPQVEDWSEDMPAAIAPAAAVPFRVDSEERAAWVVDKLVGFEERMKRLDTQHAAMKKELEGERDRFRARFALELQDWAAANAPKKGRSIKLLTGTVGWRSVPGGPRLVDKAAVVAWAKEALPAAVITETVEKPDTDAIKAYFLETGETIPGLEVVDAEDRFYVKA